MLDHLWVEPDPENTPRLYGEVIGRGAARVQPVPGDAAALLESPTPK